MTKRKGIRLLAALALCLTLCFSSVSYTHLDVYKRQSSLSMRRMGNRLKKSSVM